MITQTIRPSQIEAKFILHGTFGSEDADKAAAEIIRLCQNRKGWLPFFASQLREMHPDILPHLNQTDNVLSVTDDFIWKCYKASPAK